MVITHKKLNMVGHKRQDRNNDAANMGKVQLSSLSKKW